MTAPASRPRVVVAGAGFGGLWAARQLARADVEVLVVDRNNYHTFLPLLYQVAASELGPTSIAYPVRSVLRRMSDADFLMAEITGLDLDARVLRTDTGDVGYDYLVLALGSEAWFYGVEGAREHCFPLKTMDQAVPLRHHILECFEAADHEERGPRREARLTFACIGGGPTGVEFAGALAELVYGPLLRDYRGVGRDEVRIVLLEGGDRLLPGMPDKLGRYAKERLERRGVEVRVGALVRRVCEDELELEGGERLGTATVVWSAGVRGVGAAGDWGLPLGSAGRVRVNDRLQLEGHPEVYVVGDLAHVEEDGEVLPGVAPVAVQEGTHAGQSIVRAAQGESVEPFAFDDPGMLAVIGRYSAAAHVWGRAFTGVGAWLVWAGVHIAKLVGFRNRVLVLVNWAWNYVSFERAARLILPYRGARAGDPDASTKAPPPG